MVWDYGDTINKITPALFDAFGIHELTVICELLNQALNLACGNAEEKEGHDYSYTWRDRIEEITDRGFYDLQNAFVTGIRDASVRLISKNPRYS